jgi:2,5-diketo-D-gluconate reductase B
MDQSQGPRTRRRPPLTNEDVSLADAKPSPIPPLGLGTYGRTGKDGLAAILTAIEIGYRHLDTAQTYDTESNVGEAVRRSGLSRDAFFVTTKVADTNLSRDRFMRSVEDSIATLGIGPADLLLIHWPSFGNAVPLDDYIELLAVARQKGLTRHVGVSNFTTTLLDRTNTLLGAGVLATNQVEIHPYLQAPKLAAYARKIGLPLTAYQPLAKGRVEADPVLAGIARRHGVTASAIAVAFLIAEGHIPIPASSSDVHLRANFAGKDVRLNADEIASIRQLDRGLRLINPDKSPAWDD